MGKGTQGNPPKGKRKPLALSHHKRPPSFSGHLWRIVHYDKLLTVGDIAEIVGKAPKTIYNWTEGRARPTLEEVYLIYRSTGLSEILQYFLEDAPHVLVQKPETPLDKKQVLTQQLEIGQAYGEFISELKEAISDDNLNRGELRRIKWTLAGLIKEAAELETNIIDKLS